MPNQSILFISHCFPMNQNDLRGVFFTKIVNELIEAGQFVGIIAPQWQNAEPFNWSARNYTFVLNRKLLSERQSFLSRILTLSIFYTKLLYIFIRNRHDLNEYETIVFCFGFPAGLFSLFTKKKLIRKIIWWQGTDYYCLKGFIKFYLLLLGRSVQHASAGIHIKKFLNNYSHKKVLHLPIDAGINNHQLRAELLEVSEVKNLLAVGRLEPVKQFDKLIESFQELDSKKYTLTIVGDGSERDYLKGIAAENNNIFFTGALSRDKTLSKMRGCDFLMVTSKTEGLPTVFFEGLSCGKQCIGTNVGDLGFLCKKYIEVGFIMDGISSSQISKGIAELEQVDGAKLKKVADHILQKYHIKQTIEILTDAK